MTDLNELAATIHENAVAKGFWDGDRNFGELIALMTSELSEALEEHRNGKPLEYWEVAGNTTTNPGVAAAAQIGLAGGGLPKPEGIAVELADCAIRVLDTLHSMGVDIAAFQAPPEELAEVFAESITRIGIILGDAYQLHFADETEDAAAALAQAVATCRALAEQQGCTDWWGVVERKMAYNATREHKHGKAY